MDQDSKSPRETRPSSLGRDIALVLAFKAVALAAIYIAFFGPARRVGVTPGTVAAIVAGPAQIQKSP